MKRSLLRLSFIEDLNKAKLKDLKMKPNKKLSEWIKSQPVVYADDKNGMYSTMPFKVPGPNAHTAILVNVQPIEPEVKDTAESLLKELIDDISQRAVDYETSEWERKFIDRYNKLGIDPEIV